MTFTKYFIITNSSDSIAMWSVLVKGQQKIETVKKCSEPIHSAIDHVIRCLTSKNPAITILLVICLVKINKMERKLTSKQEYNIIIFNFEYRSPSERLK